ncbi:MAG: hypothetical protein F6K11_32490 [Leptolyngbya sp. SIO3F4]|nr:hypothetical protein [Leptolyngbya sp. SIO3F4]
MDNENFWMSYLNIKGTQRIAPDLMDKFFTKKQQKNLTYSLRVSPGWGEVTFSNTFHGDYFSLRDYLLGYVFATVQNQYGFALEIANKGYHFSNDNIFLRLQTHAVNKIKSNNKKWFIYYLVEGLYKKYLKYRY